MAHQLSPKAEADLDDIWLYVANESGSLDIATRLIDSITNQFFLLADIHILAALGTMNSVPGREV